MHRYTIPVIKETLHRLPALLSAAECPPQPEFVTNYSRQEKEREESPKPKPKGKRKLKRRIEMRVNPMHTRTIGRAARVPTCNTAYEELMILLCDTVEALNCLHSGERELLLQRYLYQRLQLTVAAAFSRDENWVKHKERCIIGKLEAILNGALYDRPRAYGSVTILGLLHRLDTLKTGF